MYKRKYIVGYFDKKTEKHIEDIWNTMRVNNCMTVKDNRPHMKFFDLEDVEIATDFIETIISRENIFNLFITQIGTFMDTGVLYFQPTITYELLAFHQEFFEIVREYMNEDSLYLPDIWIPHITIDIDLTEDQLIQAFKDMRDLKPFEIKFTTMAIIEVTFENDVPVTSKDLFTIDLRE
ncbi:2'-5' RNA ligase family protein [Acidaminobacter sp. JC074]|uniref:2'-5' RNA ligase family protein n=1 Tax=Acidaminobacter sp. JC074 TaxID=2530199 RepID=UPI001F1068DE|nr:2'-5' RNA ligase family protein [Acidaminobacter sp. JC074]MCH4889476.1 2'-5' RNA ligase family protein [Acidaminobacter sp. JC074]